MRVTNYFLTGMIQQVMGMFACFLESTKKALTYLGTNRNPLLFGTLWVDDLPNFPTNGGVFVMIVPWNP